MRRDYLHWIRKYKRFEKRHRNIPVHCSPAFRVREGDLVTMGECRPLSKTVSTSVPSCGCLNVVNKTLAIDTLFAQAHAHDFLPCTGSVQRLADRPCPCNKHQEGFLWWSLSLSTTIPDNSRRKTHTQKYTQRITKLSPLRERFSPETRPLS